MQNYLESTDVRKPLAGGLVSLPFQINTAGRLLTGDPNPPTAGKGGGCQSGNAPSPSLGEHVACHTPQPCPA